MESPTSRRHRVLLRLQLRHAACFKASEAFALSVALELEGDASSILIPHLSPTTSRDADSVGGYHESMGTFSWKSCRDGSDLVFELSFVLLGCISTHKDGSEVENLMYPADPRRCG
jgi:hypothetical protein